MTWLSVLLLVAAAAPDSTTVVVTRRTAIPAAAALALCDDVSRALKQAGVPVSLEPTAAARALANLGVKDTSACQGRMQCIVEFGRQLDVEIVVAMSISDFEGERSVVLEPYRVSTGAALARGTLLFKVGARPAAQELAEFSQRTRAALAQARPAPDAPRKNPEPVALVSPPAAALAPAPALVSAPPVEPRAHSRAPALVVGAIGAAALVASGVLALNAELTRGRLEASVHSGRSTLSGSSAASLARSANGQFTGSGITVLAGVALGVTAVFLW